MTDKPKRIVGPGRKRVGLGSGARTIKMLRPTCVSDPANGKVGCQDGPNVPVNWYRTCPHEPYYSTEAITEREPQLEPDPDDPSRMIVRGYQEKVRWVETPNLVQIAVSSRVNWLRGVARARAKGCIMPEEHPTKPLEPYCQYHECWESKPKVRTAEGDYCDTDQARMAMANHKGLAVEVLDRGKRRRLLEEVPL